MLQLKEIKKDYKTAGQTVQALKGVNLRFRANEFVSILGPSGCGKTTLLNIIGGLDQYTSGDLVICGVSTKNYKDHDWDVYRNHRIGFVFQSYNLIPHQTVLGNVEIALTIAGISKAERRKRAEEALIKVGLEKELHKRPNQLSGGQMQRVAIARALVNNPEILLADEPTGALDTTTSVQIMDLIREIAGERLVIMVTHNPELAEQYSTRIVRLQDGLVLSDTNPYEGEEAGNYNELPSALGVKKEAEVTEQAEETIQAEIVEISKEEKKKAAKEAKKQARLLKKQQKKEREKSSMSFKTSLGLSARNLAMKKGRTIITSVAGSIGIISVCLVLALSNGFNKYILKTEEDMLSHYPVEIAETTFDVEAIMSGMSTRKDMPDLSQIGDRVYVNSFLTSIAQGMQVTNNLSDEYIAYLEAMDKSLYTAIQYNYGVTLTDNLFTNVQIGEFNGQPLPPTPMSLSRIKETYVEQLASMGEENAEYAKLAPLVEYLGAVVSKMPGTSDFNDERFLSYVTSQYDVIAGELPKSSNEALLVIGGNNDVTDLTLAQLGFLSQEQFLELFESKDENKESYVTFEEILNKKFTLYYNDAVYVRNTDQSAENPYFYNYNSTSDTLDVKTDASGNPNGVSITVSGILRLKKDLTYGCLANGLNLTEQLVDEYVQKNLQSEISKWLTNEENKQDLYKSAEHLQDTYKYQAMQTGGDYTAMFRAVGAVKEVDSIEIYTENFETKEGLLNYLDKWNVDKDTDGQVKYTDTVGVMMTMVQTMLDAITYVLVAFTSISLVVSSVMIGIITYVSVVERVKEIGVLRSLGARKKDIKNLFNAETFIIGLASGVFGVAVTYLLSIGINALMKVLTGIGTLAALPAMSAITMVIISILLTLISGLIPAKAAANKDPVVALRTE